MLRLFKRLRAVITFLLVLLILGAGGYAAFRLGAGATPDDLKRDVGTGVDWARSDDGALTAFVRRAIQPVANPGSTLHAVRVGIFDARKEVSKWTRMQRRSLTDGRELIREAAETSRRPPGSMQTLLTSAQALWGAETEALPDLPESVQVYFAPTPAGSPPMETALTKLIAEANERIDCACFEITYMKLAQALVDRHRNGVAVQVMTDTDYQGDDAVEFLQAEGVAVQFDGRSGFMHDKFCVFDGQTVWTGSANFSENSFQHGFNDALVFHSIDIARDYKAEFDEMFSARQFGRRSPSATPVPRLVLNDMPVEVYFSPEDRVQNEIIAESAESRQRIDFMMFSFTSEPLAEALLMRIIDGVEVRGIMEKSQAGMQASRDEFLAQRGAQIYVDENDATFHHKAMIIDAKTVITGSYNYSSAAENENDENVVIVESPQLAARYLEVMNALIRP